MAFNITSSPSNAEILASLLGDTTGLSNIQITTTGNPLAVGLFQDSPVNLGSGVLISTGQASRVLGGNASDRSNVSTVFNGSGTVPDGNDAITLEITFDADAVSRQLFFQYVFGSEEFLDFAGSSFNDRLTIELNGGNLAKLNNGNLVNVNSLTPGNDPTAFSPDYINNLSISNPAYYQTVLDGYTVPLTLQGSLLSNASNRLVITIQDIGDGAVDSAVFLAAGSLGVSTPIPTVNVTAKLPSSVDEDGVSGILYTFTRTGATDKVLSVNYQLGGTATFDTDYNLQSFPGQSGTVDFAAGSAFTTVFISPKIDALVEGDETITVNLLPANSFEYNVGATGVATGTILDEDTPLNNISLTILSDLVSEDSISGNLVYSFTRTGPTTESLRVDFDLGGTAISLDDYDVLGASFIQGSIGSITFSAGSDTTFLLIDPKPDNITEPLETVGLTLTPSRNDPQLGGRSRSYIIDTPSAVTGNIIDAQLGRPSISLFISPSEVSENDQTSLSYIFTRTGSLTSPLTVQYFVRGTARLGEDYAVAGAASFDDTIGTVTFQAGAEFAVVDVTPTPDSVTEPTETVILQLDTIAGAIGGYDVNTFFEVVGLIVDTTTPIINVILEPQNVDEGGFTNLFYSFSRSGSTNDALTVNYNISSTATFGADYTQTGASSFNDTSGSITFAAGSNTTNLQITALADAILDPDETINLTLASSQNYVIGSNNNSTGTIRDVPAIIPATVSLALNRATVNEDGIPNLSYTFTRDGLTDQPLTVRYQIAGTAIEDTDYSTLGTSTGESLRTFDFAAGTSTFTIRVDPTPDTVVEGDETVSLTLLPAGLGYGNTEYIVNNSAAVLGTIIDSGLPLPVIDISLASASVTEDGQANLVYRFTRSGSTNQPLTIRYSVGGTAAFTADYAQSGANGFTNNTGSITFDANSNTVLLAVDPVPDTISESDETVVLTLVDDPTYTINSSGSSSSGIITDVPPIVIVTSPTISLAVNQASANEDSMTSLSYTFTRSGSTQDPLTVIYRVGGTANRLSGAANATSDYVLNTSVVGSIHTVTFSAGSNTTTVSAAPTSDRIIEGDETVELTLVPAGNGQYIIGTTAAVVGTILDQDDNSVSLAVSPSQVAEDGTENLVYTFTRTGSTSEALLVDYELGGNAAFGTDYVVTGSSVTVNLNIGTVNFAAGSDTATVIIDPTTDTITETNENITLRLVPSSFDAVFGARTYNINTPDAISGIITDVTPTVSIALSPGAISENGTTSLVYTFTRIGSTSAPLAVSYSVGGTAAFSSDYTQIGASSFTDSTGTINFAENASTTTLTITSIADAITEPNETVLLNLISDPTYVVGANSNAAGTILDQNSTLPIIGLSLSPTNVNEDGITSLVYTFTRSGATNTLPITVNFRVGGTAGFSGDYLQTGASIFATNTGTITFEANSNTAILSLTPVADQTIEQNETIDITLIAGSGYGNLEYIVGNSTAVTGTIVDQDDNSVSLAISPSEVAEDGTENLVYTFTRTGSTSAPLAVSYSVGGTAAFSSDYNQVGASSFTSSIGTIEFAENASTATLTITSIADAITEPNETVDLTLLSGSENSNYIIGTPSTQTGTIINVNEPPTSGLNFIGTNNLDVGTVNNSSNGIFAVNPNNINFVGDEINLLGGADSVGVPNKNITLQQNNPNQAIQIGSVDSNSPSILDLTPTDLAAISNGFSRIIFGRANGTGNININSNITFRDPVLLQSPGGQLNITAPISLIDDATLDFNVQTLVKSGASTLTIDGTTVTTFIGNTTIDGGVLVLAKSPNTEALRNAPILINSGVLRLGNNEQVSNGADLTLNGGTFNLNGFNETLDRLQVINNSTINLGNGSSKLAFGNSSTANWTGVLSIENWSVTSGETIRFGNSATGLTTAQLNDIQFVGFNRGANINTSGFITPVGTTVTNITPDQDGVSEDIEDLAPNNGDGNLDGIRDGLQENVASILNLGGTDINSIATIIARAGAKISGLRSLANPITTATLTSLANPIEFKVTSLANGAATTVEYLISKTDQNRRYNTYLMFGATADNSTPHAYEFLYDGQTGAKLFDTNGDGFTDKAIVHFVDGQRGDSDLSVNGEIQDPGAPGISSTPISLSIDTNNVVQLTGTAGAAIANFSLVANQTKQVSEVGFFKIDGANAVRGIAANAADFARTALQSGQVIFSSLADTLLSTTDISRQLQLNAGDRLGFYLVQNGTVDNALQKNDFSNVLFSIDQANPASRKALEVTTETNGSYRLKWEQGSATVADDLILNLQLQSNPLNNQNLVAGIQGDRESELLDLSSFTGQDVQVNFTIKREAAFNDTVGFYKVEDAQGTVTSITGAKIKPGETGYQAAVVQNRITGVDLAVANGQTASIDAVLRGGAIYAPFLIANANPGNLNGNFSNVYTSYTVGNADTTDHVRLLGDNTFGFEDLVGGGDQDFNDVVLRAVFKNS